MLIPSLLLSSVVATVLSTGGRTAQDCTIGEKWTDKYVRFECYQGTGAVVKGVRAIGCVPANTEGGAMIQPGTTYDEQYFTYNCSKIGDVVAYEIINCRDMAGKALAVGESREMTDGSTWKCYRDETGAVKLSQKTFDTCEYDGKTYAVGKQWTKPAEFKVTVAGKEQVIGKAIVMQCIGDAKKGFVATEMGCVTINDAGVRPGFSTMVNSLYVTCVAANGTLTMTAVLESELTCTINGTTLKSGQNYTTPDGINIYLCSKGQLAKIGCVIEGKPYISDRLTHYGFFNVSGKPYHCNSGDGFVDFGNITGCTLPDGSFKQVETSWTNGTERHACRYKITGNVVSTFIEIQGCAYNDGLIYKNDIFTYGTPKVVKKCALVEGKWMLRDLTAEEYRAYTGGESTNVIGGVGGEGTGADVTAKSLTTTTSAPTTTTTTTASTSEKPTTTTSITVLPSTSKTTTTVAVPQPTPSTTPEPAQCHDLFDMCSMLSPICHNDHSLSVTNLKKIVKSSNMTVEQIRAIVNLVGSENGMTSSEEQRAEIDEVVRGLAGVESEDGEEQEENCGCRDDLCVSRCQRRRKPSCKKCRIFKRKVHELVVMVCPATCGSCEKVGKVPAIIRALVRFYTHDCR